MVRVVRCVTHGEVAAWVAPGLKCYGALDVAQWCACVRSCCSIALLQVHCAFGTTYNAADSCTLSTLGGTLHCWISVYTYHPRKI